MSDDYEYFCKLIEIWNKRRKKEHPNDFFYEGGKKFATARIVGIIKKMLEELPNNGDIYYWRNFKIILSVERDREVVFGSSLLLEKARR